MRLHNTVYMGMLSWTCSASLASSFQCQSSQRLSFALSSSYLDGLASQEPLDSFPAGSYNSGLESVGMTVQTPSSFDYIPILRLDQANLLADKVIECCQRNAFNPITVYVLDNAGHTLVSKRMDGCSPVGLPDFAKAKAFSCIVNKYPSRNFRDRYTVNGKDDSLSKFGQMLGMIAISQGEMASFPGGILIKLGNDIVGAIGVSGAAGDEDEYCAIRAVMESGLGISPVPEEHSCATVKDNL